MSFARKFRKKDVSSGSDDDDDKSFKSPLKSIVVIKKVGPRGPQLSFGDDEEIETFDLKLKKNQKVLKKVKQAPIATVCESDIPKVEVAYGGSSGAYTSESLNSLRNTQQFTIAAPTNTEKNASADIELTREEIDSLEELDDKIEESNIRALQKAKDSISRSNDDPYGILTNVPGKIKTEDIMLFRDSRVRKTRYIHVVMTTVLLPLLYCELLREQPIIY